MTVFGKFKSTYFNQDKGAFDDGYGTSNQFICNKSLFWYLKEGVIWGEVEAPTTVCSV